MNASTNRLRYLLCFVRECGDAFAIMRLVSEARAAVYAESTGPYRPGVTETMIALDTALCASENSAPLDRVRAAYHTAVATCYATQGFVSPTVAAAMARLEHATIMRDTMGDAVFHALDEIDSIVYDLTESIASVESIESIEAEQSEAGEAGEAERSEEGEAVEAERTEEGEAVEAESVEAVEAERSGEVEAGEAVEAERSDEGEAERSEEVEASESTEPTETVDSEPTETVEAVEAEHTEEVEAVEAGESEPTEEADATESTEAERSEATESTEAEATESEDRSEEEPVVGNKSQEAKDSSDSREARKKKKKNKDASVQRELAAMRLELASARRERDDALLESARCARCERTAQTIVRFWAIEGGRFTEEKIRPVDDETQKWSLYVEKMRGVIEHMRSGQEAQESQ
jgi:hypothetical protein